MVLWCLARRPNDDEGMRRPERARVTGISRGGGCQRGWVACTLGRQHGGSRQPMSLALHPYLASVHTGPRMSSARAWRGEWSRALAPIRPLPPGRTDDLHTGPGYIPPSSLQLFRELGCGGSSSEFFSHPTSPVLIRPGRFGHPLVLRGKSGIIRGPHFTTI